MNHRLDELFVRAGGQFGHYGEPILSDIEVFAELIVRDCRDMFVVNSPSWNLLNEKLEHFGVEE